jgi:hypothetical protein
VSEKWRGLLFPALLSLIVAVIAAWATAYWTAGLTEGFRTKSRIVLSAGGFIDDLPASKISLTGDDLITLDGMTSKDSPDEISKMINDIKRTSVSQLSDVLRERSVDKNISDPFVNLNTQQKLDAILTHQESELVSVTLSAIKQLTEYIETSPSKDYIDYKNGKIPEDVSQHWKDKIPVILQSSNNTLEAISKIREFDPDVADALSVLARGELGNYNTFKNYVLRYDPSQEFKDNWSNNDEVLRNIKLRINRAESEQVAGVRLEIPLSATNLGQTPVTLSKYAVLSTLDNKIIIPVTIESRSDRVVIPPIKTEDLILITPRKDQIPDTWDELSHARNNLSAVAEVELLSFDENEVIRAPFSIAGGIDIRKNSIASILRKTQIAEQDVLKYLEQPAGKSSSAEEDEGRHLPN